MSRVIWIDSTFEKLSVSTIKSQIISRVWIDVWLMFPPQMLFKENCGHTGIKIVMMFVGATGMNVLKSGSNTRSAGYHTEASFIGWWQENKQGFAFPLKWGEVQRHVSRIGVWKYHSNPLPWIVYDAKSFISPCERKYGFLATRWIKRLLNRFQTICLSHGYIHGNHENV